MAKGIAWTDAIRQVLKDHGQPMRYEAIAQEILDRGLRAPTATPAATVAATLSLSLSNEGAHSPFERIERGIYGLRGSKAAHRPQNPPASVAGVVAGDGVDDAAADAEDMGLINAFGMFWLRDEVYWDRNSTRLLGVQQLGGKEIDFADQAGVYLLYDGNRVVYVGRVTGTRLGSRMWEHTRDRLTGRWDRFSWFGVRGVTESGSLTALPGSGIAVESLISTLEALLIEGLEPPQNRRQGDGFNAVEFLQVLDPEIQKQRDMRVIEAMQANYGSRGGR